MSRKYANDVLPTGLRVRHFDSGGAGPPVVLLHGLSNLIEIWDRVIARLSTTFRVIAFDLPGFGASDRPRASYDSEFFSAQLAALLEFYGLKRAHLVGSSLGAGIIVRFSERHLDRIDRAVIAAPGGFGRATHPMMRLPTLPLVGYGLARPSRLNTALTLRIVMRDKANITPDLQHHTNTYSAQAGSHLAFYRALRSGVGLFGVIGRDSFARIARQMACPTLVVWGRHDRVFPSAQSEAALEMLPDGTRVLIDQCGHYPHWEQPDAFCDAVETHLAPSLPAEVSA